MSEAPFEILYQALNSENGVVVFTNNPTLLRQQLYRERKKDPSLSCLSIQSSRTNPESEILIVKNQSRDTEEDS